MRVDSVRWPVPSRARSAWQRLGSALATALPSLVAGLVGLALLVRGCETEATSHAAPATTWVPGAGERPPVRSPQAIASSQASSSEVDQTPEVKAPLERGVRMPSRARGLLLAAAATREPEPPARSTTGVVAEFAPYVPPVEKKKPEPLVLARIERPKPVAPPPEPDPEPIAQAEPPPKLEKAPAAPKAAEPPPPPPPPAPVVTPAPAKAALVYGHSEPNDHMRAVATASPAPPKREPETAVPRPLKPAALEPAKPAPTQAPPPPEKKPEPAPPEPEPEPVKAAPSPPPPPVVAPPAPEPPPAVPAPKPAPSKPVSRPKRPTPMTPQEATRYLADAWLRASGEPPTIEVLSVLWAQWALETGRGRWMVDYNYAGLKGCAQDGGWAHWYTWEETAKGPNRIRARFRNYTSAEDGALDYVSMLLRRYPRAAAAARRGEAANFVLELDHGGFFTELPKHYVGSVISLAREFRREQHAVRF